MTPSGQRIVNFLDTEPVSGLLQDDIKSASKQFGIPYNPEGICYGLTVMATLAFLDKSPDAWGIFLHRVKSFQMNHDKKLDDVVASVRRAIESPRIDIASLVADALTPPAAEEPLIRLPATEAEMKERNFLILLNLIQSPEKLADYLHQPIESESLFTILRNLPTIVRSVIDSGVLPDFCLSTISTILESAVLACSARAPEEFLDRKRISGVYSPAELKVFFESLRGIDNPQRFSVILKSMHHAVTVLYQAPNQIIFVDANQGIFPCKDVDDLLPKVLAGFFSSSETRYLAVDSEFICTREEGLINPLEQLSRLECWAHIQQITEDKAHLHGKFYWQAIELAVANGELAKVENYLRGADKTSATFNGLIFLAAEYGHLPIVEALLKAGASSDGLIFHAVKHGHLPIVEALLKAGASVDGLIFLAAEHGHLPIVEFLLKAGASPYQMNNGSRTPITIARDHGHELVAARLLQHQAKLSFNNILASLIKSIRAYIAHNLLHRYELFSSHGLEGRIAAERILKKLAMSNLNALEFNGTSTAAVLAEYQTQVEKLQAFAIAAIPPSSGMREHSLRKYLQNFVAETHSKLAVAEGLDAPILHEASAHGGAGMDDSLSVSNAAGAATASVFYGKDEKSNAAHQPSSGID